MLERIDYLRQIDKARVRSPVTALLGARQCGKTTIARAFSENREATFFDLESEVDMRLDHLFVVCPSGESYPVRERISVLSLFKESDLAGRIEAVMPSRDRAGD